MNSADSINSLCPRHIPPSPNFLPDTFDTSFLSVLRLGVIICVAAVTVVLRTRILLLLLVASIGHPTIGEASLSKGEVTGFYTLGRPYRMHFKLQILESLNWIFYLLYFPKLQKYKPSLLPLAKNINENAYDK